MSEIDEESIKQWSLTFSDLISTKLKANISFKDFESEEVIYNEFLTNISEPHYVTLCENKDNQESIIIAINYQSVIAATNNFFSINATVSEKETQTLSFSENFIAQEICNEIIKAFTSNELNMKLIRSEPQINLVRPFHDDESITIYKFKWTINNEDYGELKICHSHVL